MAVTSDNGPLPRLFKSTEPAAVTLSFDVLTFTANVDPIDPVPLAVSILNQLERSPTDRRGPDHLPSEG